MESSVSYKSLLEKFEITKKQLGEAEASIKKITGRNNELQNGPGGLNKWKNQNQLGGIPGVIPFAGKKRQLFPIGKPQEPASLIKEESPVDEDEIPSKKPSLSSTVVASLKDKKSKRDIIQEQNVNSKVKARNRRMMGMILGTLQKFQHEAKKTKDKDMKRAKIEQKVEIAAAEERERIKKEKDELYRTRKEKQIELRCLEKKMEIAELHEAWEESHKHLVNFIKTTTAPHIFYLPATHNAASEKRLKESQAQTLELIRLQNEKVEKELQEAEEFFRKEPFPVDKENIVPDAKDDFEMVSQIKEEVHELENVPQDEGHELENVPHAQENEHELENIPHPQEEDSQLSNNHETVTNGDEERTNDEVGENISSKEFEPIYD